MRRDTSMSHVTTVFLTVVLSLSLAGTSGCDSSESTPAKSPLSGGGVPSDGAAGDSTATEDTSWCEFSFCVFENGTCPEGCGRAEGRMLDTEANCWGPILPLNVCYGIQPGGSGAVCCTLAPDGSIYQTVSPSCSIGPHTGWKPCPNEWLINALYCQ